MPMRVGRQEMGQSGVLLYFQKTTKIRICFSDQAGNTLLRAPTHILCAVQEPIAMKKVFFWRTDPPRVADVVEKNAQRLHDIESI